VAWEHISWEDAVADLRITGHRPEFEIEEVPAPARLATHSVALSVDAVSADDDELATGRFVLLHEIGGQPTWEGDFRIVTFVRAPIEPDVVTDDLFDEVAWSWLTEALGNVDYVALAGTVTRTASRSFAALEDRREDTELEIRASWTPRGPISAHFSSWLSLIESCAGLAPIPEGVTAIGRTRQ
jgi:hypothetical protein